MKRERVRDLRERLRERDRRENGRNREIGMGGERGGRDRREKERDR